MITQIENHILKISHDPAIQEVISYMFLPPGKLLRSQFVACLAKDLHIKDSSFIENLSLSVESHHLYSLIHDDLPAMDNDDFRRNKLSCHKKFNEWKAILAGDLLLSYSYHVLSSLPVKEHHSLSTILAWCSGGKGLIQGQWHDMERKEKIHINDLIRIYELKTSRLFQYIFLATFTQKPSCSIKDAMRIGSILGILFQLIDDYHELANMSSREEKINPFINHYEELKEKMIVLSQKLENILEKRQLTHTHHLVKSCGYFTLDF